MNIWFLWKSELSSSCLRSAPHPKVERKQAIGGGLLPGWLNILQFFFIRKSKFFPFVTIVKLSEWRHLNPMLIFNKNNISESCKQNSVEIWISLIFGRGWHFGFRERNWEWLGLWWEWWERPVVGSRNSRSPILPTTLHTQELPTWIWPTLKKYQRKLAKNDMHGRGSPSSLEARSASQFVRLKAARLFARASDLRQT